VAQKKQPFDLILPKQAAAGSNDVRSDPVPAGELWCVQHLTLENETTDFTSARVIKGGRGDEFLLEEQLDPEGGQLYWMTDNVYYTEGQYPLVRFAGCTVNDRLRVYLTGWKQEGRELDA
jgi:hypothetical protein